MPKYVFANGCFDTFHAGHYCFLHYCWMQAEYKNAKLIVAIDSDKKIKKDKGEHRPYFDQWEREKQILYCFPEAEIEIFDTNKELEAIIEKYRPELLIKSRQWEGKVVGEKYAKCVIFNEDKVPISTTEIEKRIQEKYKCVHDQVKEWLEEE